jgi:hypothetical protein
MSNSDLVFKTLSTQEVIHDPLQVISSTLVQVQVTNYGTEDLADLGLFVLPTTTLGDVDNPANYPPETDYQDLIEMGTSTSMALQLAGGLKITLPQNSGSVTEYITRTKGSKLSNKIPFIDLASGASAVFTLEIETPPSVTARRLFVNIAIE